MLPFIVSSVVAGAVITYVVPPVVSWVSALPGISNFVSNRIVNLILVGAVVTLTLGFAMGFARKVKL